VYTRYATAATGEETVLDFGVSGKLWNGVLIMYDRGTDSLWTQLDGRALRGPLAGSRLEHFPSTFTTWSEWRALYPDTLVLEKTDEDDRKRTASNYADYFADPERVYFPELTEGLNGVPPKETVFGVFDGEDAVAVSAQLLAEHRIIPVEFQGEPLLFVAGDTGGDVVAIRGFPQLEPRPGISVHERLYDRASGEERRTSELEPLRVDRAFWYAWSRSHPGSSVVLE